MRHYLSPEPLLQDPDFVRLMAEDGLAVPTYAYANNNPLRNVDPDGRQSIPLPLPIPVPVVPPIGGPTANAFCFGEWCIQDWAIRPRDQIEESRCQVFEMAKGGEQCRAAGKHALNVCLEMKKQYNNGKSTGFQECKNDQKVCVDACQAKQQNWKKICRQ